MAVFWIALTVVGLLAAILASRVAVERAALIAVGTRIPPFLIGITLLAVGTDLPEIANSIVASLADEGDLNIGDSVGSAATQATLVLGLLPLVAGGFAVGRNRVAAVSLASVTSLAVGAWLVSDGFLARTDALILVGLWIAGSVLIFRQRPVGAEPVMAVEFPHRARHSLVALLALAVVGGGAAAAVVGFTELAELLDVPTYMLAFFAASLGTSLPELVVDITALRRGERDMAVGDVLGSTFVDSSLSIGAGPLLAPTAVTASLGVQGALAAAVAVAIVGMVLVLRQRHDAWTGLTFIAIYALFYVVLLG